MRTSDLKSFWKKYYKPKSSLLIVSGGVKTEDVRIISERFFGKSQLSGIFVAPKFTYIRENKFSINKVSLPQVTIQLSFEIPSQKDSRYYALHILRAILMIGWGSRFQQRLRVKENLIYSSSAGIYRYFDTAALVYTTATAKENLKKLLNTISEELRRVKKSGIRNSEYNRALNYIEGILLTSNETARGQLLWYARDELYQPQDVESLEERIKNLRKVTKDKVEEVATEFITNDNWQLAVVGDVDEKKIEIDL